MSMADCIFPWPWKVVETGAPPHYDYFIKDSNGQEIAFYSGPNAHAKANVIMEMGACYANRNRELGKCQIATK